MFRILLPSDIRECIIWCKDRVTSGKTRSATYEIKPTDKYVRVELIDAKGNMAWSSLVAVNIEN